MRFVNDERVVGQQQRIGLGFGQQDAVGHEFHRGIARQLVLKAYLVAHHLTQRGFQLVGDAFGNRCGGDTAGLGVANDLATFWFAGVGGSAFALTGYEIGVCPQFFHLRLGAVGPTAAAKGQSHFGQLRCFARAGFAANNDDLVRLHGGHDVLAPFANGQVLGEFNNEGL